MQIEERRPGAGRDRPDDLAVDEDRVSCHWNCCRAGDAEQELAAVCDGGKRLASPKGRLLEIDEPAEPRLNGRHRRIHVDAVVENPCLDSTDAERLEALDGKTVRLARRDEMLPERATVDLRRGVDLESKLARPTGARDQDLLPAHPHRGDTVVAERVGRTAVTHRCEHIERGRASVAYVSIERIVGLEDND